MNERIVDDLLREPERYELFEEAFWGTELDRRAFFRVVGSGLIVACAGSEAIAQQPGRGRRGGFGAAGPKELGAWLHIGEDSAVTVYTGKVEIGQNIRTALTQVVAEELHLPLERIRLVMADTQWTPFDFGTAGSSSTPRMAPQLRRAAAAARELLLDLAAEQGQVKRETLGLQDGKVVTTDGKALFTFGQLTQGKKLMKVIDDTTPTTPAEKWTRAGTSLPKVDGRDFVTGAHRYASDIKRPGMMFGKVLRPPCFKAELLKVQTAEAEKLPGVTVVRDGSFVGVAAATEQEAAKALALLRAQWKTLPQPSSEELFEYLKKHPSRGDGGFGGRGARDSRGSIAAGLKAADRQLQATYTIAYIAHAPMEPRAAVAEWNNGKLTVWTGTQMPVRVRSELARAFDLPEERVRVIVPDMGSGYGGKHSGEAAVEAARLAKAAGKPVKLVWTRQEEFTWAYFRPAGVIEVTAGVTDDGTLTAWECHNYNSGGSALRTPYESANVHTEFHPTDAPLRQGSYRALAATANTFARETHMDDLAHAIGLDPLAFRLKNLKDGRLRAVLETAADRFGWGKGKPADNHGFGIACGTEKGSYVATCAEVAVERGNGRVKVLRVATAFECGAILNPNHLKNQVEGAAVMALGGALFEAIRFANGKILNPRFADYRVPRFADVPLFETVLLDRKDLPSAGAGETPLIALAPAVGNAIFQATGVRLRSLPMAPKGVKAS
jgi:nicotinate dehydrogenase subunit B